MQTSTLIFMSFCFEIITFGQSNSTSNSPMLLPVLVDGSQNPAGIPDAIAYRHFIMSLCAHHIPQPHEAARRLYLLDHIRLSSDDERGLVTALDGVQERIDALTWSEGKPLSASEASSRQDQLTLMLDSAVANLNALLTEGGKAKIANWVASQVKRNTIIVGTAAHGH
jgi:hypothetical protein